jgi:hypothetical protein
VDPNKLEGALAMNIDQWFLVILGACGAVIGLAFWVDSRARRRNLE